ETERLLPILLREKIGHLGDRQLCLFKERTHDPPTLNSRKLIGVRKGQHPFSHPCVILIALTKQRKWSKVDHPIIWHLQYQCCNFSRCCQVIFCHRHHSVCPFNIK